MPAKLAGIMNKKNHRMRNNRTLSTVNPSMRRKKSPTMNLLDNVLPDYVKASPRWKRIENLDTDLE